MASTSDVAGALAAIEAKLTAAWTTTPVVFDNQDPPDSPWPPQDGSGKPLPWVFCEIVGVNSEILAFGKPGDQTVIDNGIIQLNVMAQKGAGLADARTQAVALGEIFRQQKFYNSDPTAYVRTFTPRVMRGSLTSDDGNWVSMLCSIPYEFYHQA